MITKADVSEEGGIANAWLAARDGGNVNTVCRMRRKQEGRLVPEDISSLVQIIAFG